MRMHQNAPSLDAQSAPGPLHPHSASTADSYTSSKWHWKSNHALSARLYGSGVSDKSGKGKDGHANARNGVHDVLMIQLDALVGLVDENATRRLWKCTFGFGSLSSLFGSTACSRVLIHGL